MQSSCKSAYYIKSVYVAFFKLATYNLLVTVIISSIFPVYPQNFLFLTNYQINK